MKFLIITFVFVVLFIVAMGKREHEGFALASAIADYNINEREYTNNKQKKIVPQIYWTYRYLAKNYSKLIHEWLIELEGDVTPRIQPFNTQHATSIKIDRKSPLDLSILKIFDYLQSRLNTSPQIIQNPTKYYRKNDVIMIPLTKNRCYDTQVYYQKDLNENTNNKIFVIMRVDSNDNIVSLGVSGLPKIVNYEGLARNNENYGEIKDNAKIMKTPEQTGRLVQMLKQRRLQDKLSRCFVKKELDNVDNDVGSEQSCIISGGVWDYPCKRNEECPYYKGNRNYPNEFGKCNTNTGYCELPVGMKESSYRQGSGKPVCYSCKKGRYGPESIGECCSEQASPDYNFKGDSTIRSRYKALLQSKGLNWYKY